MKHLAHFLLVFIASAGEIAGEIANPTIGSTCSVKLKKKQITIEETPINFRDSSVSGDEKQIFMRLTDLSETDKDCMDRNKFNLIINLKKPIAMREDNMKVNRTATQHNVIVGKNYVGIESCTLGDQKISNEYRMLLNFIGSDNLKGKKQENFQETIIFIAPAELTGLEKNIKSLEIDFKDLKEPCETYRGVFINSFL